MNFFKKSVIADIETTKQNKHLVVASAVLIAPVLVSNIYELYLREKIQDSERADQIGTTLTAVAMIGNLVSIIPSIKYHSRRRKIYKSL